MDRRGFRLRWDLITEMHWSNVSNAKSIDTLATANFMKPFFNACFLFLCFVTTQAQQNPCAAYQLTPENSHSGPRQFNVIQLDYSHLSSFVLISDPSGRQIGTGQDGKRVAKLPHAFYEDGDDAIAATGLGPEKEPEEITIQYPQTGEYEIFVTSRNSNAQWIRSHFITAVSTQARKSKFPLAKLVSLRGGISPINLRPSLNPS